MTFVNEYQSIILFCQITDFWQRGHISIHGKDSVSGNQPSATLSSLLKLGLQIFKNQKAIMVFLGNVKCIQVLFYFPFDIRVSLEIVVAFIEYSVLTLHVLVSISEFLGLAKANPVND